MGGGAAAHAGKSLLSKFFPAESYTIVVPVAFAVGFFSVTLYRIALWDPDTRCSHKEKFTFTDEAGNDFVKGSAKAKNWVSEYFHGRRGHTSVFPNEAFSRP